MKKTSQTPLLFTAALVLGATLFSATPSLAQSGTYEYYWATPNSFHVQPIYETSYHCEENHSSSECMAWDVEVCGQIYYSTRRVYDNAVRFLGEGYSLQLKDRGTGTSFCSMNP